MGAAREDYDGEELQVGVTTILSMVMKSPPRLSLANVIFFRLKEANKQKSFMAAVKDLEFWLGEVEILLQSDDYGKVSDFLVPFTMPCVILSDAFDNSRIWPPLRTCSRNISFWKPISWLIRIACKR